MKRITRTRVLWAIVLTVLAGYEAVSFVRLRRELAQVFDSHVQMLLLAALIAVALIGVFAKSRNSRN